MALVLLKTADDLSVSPEQIITYTVTLRNSDAALAETDITFTDIIAAGASFIADSFTINGVTQVGKNPNLGVPVPDIPATVTYTITFKVKVDTQPAPVQFTNQATAVSTLAGTTTPVTYTSNSITINVIVLEFIKTSDKTMISVGDEVTFTIVIKNIGNFILLTPVLKDTMPNCMTFQTGTFSVNGVIFPAADPTAPTGVTLTNVPIGHVVTMSFKTKATCAPCPPSFVNFATLDYQIEISTGVFVDLSITTNNAIVVLATNTFKQLSRSEYLKLPLDNPEAEAIINTVVKVSISNTKVITTPIATSKEGQILTGFKLIVEGALLEEVEYVANLPTQPVHSYTFRVPFSTFIVLPADFVVGLPIDVQGTVEDVYTTLIDTRNIFTNVTFILVVNCMCQ